MNTEKLITTSKTAVELYCQKTVNHTPYAVGGFLLGVLIAAVVVYFTLIRPRKPQNDFTGEHL